MTADDLVEQYGKALRDQAAAVAALSAAEETLDVILAELLSTSDGSEWKAKATAKASSGYKAHLKDVLDAREGAEKAKAEVEYLRVRFEAWRSKMAMQRTVRQVGS